MMTLLVRHPDTPAGAIHTIEAGVERTAVGATVTFRVSGDVARLVIPAAAVPARADGLWRSTCFELFVAGNGEAYREYNFSPSTRWAAYDFTGYRTAMGNSEAAVDIRTSIESRRLTLIADISCEIPDPAHIGLSAVIEEDDGVLRYWAVAFAPGKPDFHAEATRALLLDGVDAQ